MNATVTKIADTVENFRTLEALIGKTDVKLRTKKGRPWDECLRTAESRKTRIAVGFDIDGTFDPKQPKQWYAWAYFYLGKTAGQEVAFIDVTWEEKKGWRVHCNTDDSPDDIVPDWLQPLVKKHRLRQKPTPCSQKKAMQVVADCLAFYRKLRN